MKKSTFKGFRSRFHAQWKRDENGNAVLVEEPVHVMRSLYGQRNLVAGKGKKARRAAAMMQSNMAHVFTALRLGIPLSSTSLLQSHVQLQALRDAA